MEQAFGKYLMFQNRLEKVFRHSAKQARRLGVSCWRLYDHDLPEFPLMIEVYEKKVYVAEYKRKHSLSEEAHDAWLQHCLAIIATVLQVHPTDVYFKLRQRIESRTRQYQKLNTSKNEFVVTENRLRFIVNLSDYLDTGLFLDHRITRQMVQAQCLNKKVLNLFAYTGSFSVYAVAGRAAQVTTVDLSKTYLNWAERNMQLNFPQFSAHTLVHADVKQYLETVPNQHFDLVVMDPPTFSNSKRMTGILDVQQDHVTLINACMRILTPGGVLYFSTNYTRFQLASNQIHASQIKDITKATTPFDFSGKLKRQCFVISK